MDKGFGYYGIYVWGEVQLYFLRGYQLSVFLAISLPIQEFHLESGQQLSISRFCSFFLQ
jgi:hypothetical protein